MVRRGGAAAACLSDVCVGVCKSWIEQAVLCRSGRKRGRERESGNVDGVATKLVVIKLGAAVGGCKLQRRRRNMRKNNEAHTQGKAPIVVVCCFRCFDCLCNGVKFAARYALEGRNPEFPSVHLSTFHFTCQSLSQHYRRRRHPVITPINNITQSSQIKSTSTQINIPPTQHNHTHPPDASMHPSRTRPPRRPTHPRSARSTPSGGATRPAPPPPRACTRGSALHGPKWPGR